MTLAKPADISTLVNKSIESLQELAMVLQTKKDFLEEPVDHSSIEVVIQALQQMDNDRTKLHESLESETITASALRYKLHKMPSKIKQEMHDAVLSARQSNEVEIHKLQENLKNTNENINTLENRNMELQGENSKLEPERDDMQDEYNTVVSMLNQRMADKASKQITLNETRDTLSETRKMIIELEDSIVQLKQDLALEREEAVQEKERLQRAVEDTQGKVDEQKKCNLEKRSEIAMLQVELVDSEATLDAKRKVIRRFETSKNKLDTQVVQLSRQLQREIKANSILTQEGMKIMKIHGDVVTTLDKTKAELEHELQSLQATLEISKAENHKLNLNKQNLDAEAAVISEESDRLAEEVRDYERKLKRARDKLQAKNDECFRLKDENVELEDEIKQFKENHQVMTETYNRRIDEIKGALKSEQKERQTLLTKRDSISRDTNDFKTDYGSYMTDRTDTIQQAKADHASFTDHGNKLQKELKQMEASILEKQELLKASKVDYATTQKTLKEQLETLMESVSTLDKTIGEKKEQLNTKTPVYEQLEQNFQQSSEDFNQLKTSVVELKLHKSTLEMALQRATKELERMKEPERQLQEELDLCRAEELQGLAQQNEETKNIEIENTLCCHKLSTVMKENDRFKEANENLVGEMKALEIQKEARLKDKTTLKHQLSGYQVDLHAGRNEDLKLDKMFAERDLKILDDIQKLQDETQGREKRVEGIQSQLDNQLGLLAAFIDRVADLRPTDTRQKSS